MILKNKLYEVIKQNKEDSTVWIELKPDCFIYDSHFPELPITPGVCIIQIATELICGLMGFDLELDSIANAKFLAVINPNTTRFLEYNFNKIKFYEDNSVFKVSVVVSCNKTIFSKLSVCYKKK